MVKNVSRIVLVIGKDQSGSLFGLKNMVDHAKQVGDCLGGGFCGGADAKGNRLMSVSIQAEEGLQGFNGLLIQPGAAKARLAFGIAVQAMWIDGKQVSFKVSTGTPEPSQGNLQSLTSSNRLCATEVVDVCIGGDKGQPISHFKPFLAQTPPLPNASDTQGCLMHELER